MPNIKSAKKRVDVNKKNRAINKAYKSELATGLKRYNAAISAGDVKLAKSLMSETVSLIDESVTRGVIHKNKADRKKAEINSKLFALESSSKKTVKEAKKKEEVKEEKKEEVAAEAPKAKKTTSRAKKTETATTEEKTEAKKTTRKTTTKTTATKKTAKTEDKAE